MKIFLFVISPLLYVLSLIYPKDDRLWLFGGWFGQRYADNSKDFFEYCLRNSTENKIRCVWVLKNKEIINTVENAGGEWVHAYSWPGFKLQLKARVFVTCINSSDFIPFLISPRNYFVQLWHGSPIKHIGMDSRKTMLRKWLDAVRFGLMDRYDLVVSPADCFDPIFSGAFGVKKQKIFRTGYPRNENLNVSSERRDSIRDFYQCERETKLFIYLPTHRMEGRSMSPFVPLLEEMMKFEEKLDREKIKVLVKPHYYEKDSLDHIKGNGGIEVVYDLPFDLYELLGASDGLITDYSSVVFDYELLGRPMILFPFDFEEYTAVDRPLYFQFEDIYTKLSNTKKVNSLEELIETMERSVSTQEFLNQDSFFNVAYGRYCEQIYTKMMSDFKG